MKRTVNFAANPEVQALVQRLLVYTRRVFGSRAIADIFAWDANGLACLGLQVQSQAFSRWLPDGLLPHSGYIDAGLQRAFGWEVQIRRTRGKDVDISSAVGQTMDQPEAYIGSFFEGFETQITQWLEEHEIGPRSGFVAVLPSPAAPATNPNRPYYSARQRRVLTQVMPEGVIRLADGTKGLDVCIAGAQAVHAAGWQAGRVSWQLGATPVVLTHAINVERSVNPTTALAIRKCGGLLFPSLALMDRPAAGFGRLVLFADVGLLGLTVTGMPAAVQPRLDPGAVTVYSTDVWTERTNDFLREHSRNLYLQATGQWAPGIYTFQNHLAVLGPRGGGFGDIGRGSFDEYDGLKTWAALQHTLRARIATYTRCRTEDDVTAMQERVGHESAAWYPYLEVKVNRVLPLSAFPFAVVPKADAAKAKRWLDRIGFAGRLLVEPAPADDVWQYGTQVTARVLAAAGG